MDAAPQLGERAGRPRRADRRRSGTTPTSRRLIGPPTRVIELRGRTVTPGFQDAHVHPVHGGLDELRCDLHEDARTGALRSTVIDDVRALAPRRGLDPRRRLVHGRLPGRHAAARGPRPHRARSPGLPDQPRRPRRVGQHARARARRGDGRDRRPGRRPHRARRRRHRRRGTLHEGAMDLVERLLPDDTPSDLEEALRLGQAYLHSLGITAWQDAIVEPAAGGARVRRAGVARRADRPRRRRAVVGAPPRRRADRGVRRASRARPRSAATRRPA